VTTLEELRAALPTYARQWLDVHGSLAQRFPAVTRSVGFDDLVDGWQTDDALRVLMLEKCPPEELAELYRYGDANERRAILRSFGVLGADETAMAIARDAIRGNDPRLVVAALSSPVVEQFDGGEVDQALMKCVFMDIPLVDVPAVVERAGASAAEMLAGFVLERVTAGRSIAADVWTVIDKHPPVELLARITELTESPVPERRQAAREALAYRMSD
jgi:hypothetical protein